MMRRSKTQFSLTVAASLLATLSIPTGASFADNNDDWHYVPHSCEVKSTQAASLKNTTSPAGAVVGDWQTPGTETYNVAKETFDTLTKEYGTSGAFASGVIANMINESGLVPDRSQGPGMLRFGVTGTVPPAGSEGGGGGLFQFTPYTKFTNSSYWSEGPGWVTKSQIKFMFSTEIQGGMLDSYIPISASRYGITPYLTKTSDVLSTDDPRKAAQAFQLGYERPAAYHAEREDTAAVVDSIFNKSHISADSSKWGLHGSAVSPGDNTDVTAASSAKKSNNSESDECDKVESEGTEWADYVGEHGLTIPNGQQEFSRSELPANLKQYAIDLEKLGIPFGQCSTGWTKWTNTSDQFLNGQCVALSKVAFHEIWKKDGQPGPVFNCNGKECAQAAASAYGGSVSKTPTKGAIVSQNSASQWGHTFIVAHVFANGDIMTIEQNSGKTGASVGTACEWNFEIQTKAFWSDPSRDTQFYAPKGEGYSPDPRVAKASTHKGDPNDPSILQAAYKYDGTSYNQFGNGSATRLDCSGLVWQAYRDAGHAISERTADSQMRAVRSRGKWKSFDQLQRGDLVFWDTNGDGTVDHVAFFLSPTERFDASDYGTPNGQHGMFSIDKIVGGGSF